MRCLCSRRWSSRRILEAYDVGPRWLVQKPEPTDVRSRQHSRMESTAWGNIDADASVHALVQVPLAICIVGFHVAPS